MANKTASTEREIIDFTKSNLHGIELLGRYHYTNVKEKLSLHKHKGCIEIVYIEKGMQTYWVNKKYYTSKGGDVFITFPNELHGTHEYNEEKGNIYWLIIKIQPVPKLLSNLNEILSKCLINGLLSISNRNFKGNRNMITYLRKLFTLNANNTPLAMVETGNILNQFLIEIIKCSGSKNKDDTLSNPLKNCIEYIKTNLSEVITIEQLATKCNLSLSHFKYRFKKEIGSTPADYVLRCKIDEAVKMLTHSKIKISEVSYKLGFDNPSYFATIFKRYKGVSPGEYLKNLIQFQ